MEPTRKSNAFVGSPVERVEDLRLLKGRGQYVDDLTRPGLLHAVILRSPVAHGRIRAIDTAAARARPGVVAVITAAEIGTAVPTIPLRQEPLPALRQYQQPVIAHRKVRYVGEPIAVVVAESAALAEDALEAIVVDIAPLQAVADRAAARNGDVLLFEEAGTNIASTITAVRGDIEVAFREAAYTRRERFTVQRHSAVPMEPRGLLAEWDAGRGQMTVSGAAKVPFPNRRMLAKMLDLPETSIRMLEYDVGGGFGARGEFYPEDFLIPFAARLTGRPVKWIEDRRENLSATNHARDAECELEIACAGDGTILGLRGRAFTDLGAYLRTVGATASRNIAQVMSGPYSIPHVHMDVSLLMTNKTPSGTYRGPGRFEADFFRERLIDIAAREQGLDPVAFRRQNLDCRSRDAVCARQDPGARHRDRVRQRRLSQHARALPCGVRLGRQGRPARPADRGPLSRARDRLLHRGRRLGPEGECAAQARARRHGIGVRRLLLGRPGHRDRVCPDRRRCAGNPHGPDQGRVPRLDRSCERRLRLLQLALDRDGRLRHRAGGSRSAPGDPRRGGKRLGCAAGDIAIDQGFAIGPGRATLALRELAGLEVESSYASNKRTYSYGAHAAHVAVDPKTGQVAGRSTIWRSRTSGASSTR